MTTHTLPFGKHRGKSPAEVPADYLGWMLRTCKLTPGLRGAIRGELLGRGADPSSLPPEPEAKPLPECGSCGGDDLRLFWQPLAGAGVKAIRADCRRCGRFVCYAPQTLENIALADADAARPAPAPPATEEFELRLVALPDAVSDAVRLRQLLKSALRGQRLRCTSIRDVTPRPAAGGGA